MTNTLQKRFVITAMIAISILLAILLAGINVSHYILVEQRIDRIMATLTDARGTYTPPARPQTQPDPFPPYTQNNTPTNSPDPFRFSRLPTPDDMMGARHFSVLFDSQGQVLRTNINQIFAVTEEQASQIAQSLYGNEDSGRYEHFRYRVTDLPDGKGSLMLFLDTSAQQDSIVTVLLASCAGGLLCWLAMLLLVVLLSRRAIAPIARNMEKQKQFVTNAGHEIKTPLAIILTNTDALELHNGETKWSRNIRAQTERLNGLMQNMLALSRMDEAGTALPMSECSADQLLTELVELQQESARAKNLSLQSHIDTPLSITANREAMEQLFSILLDNAVKYTPEGGSIRVHLSREGSRTCLQLSNTCTTPPPDLEKLFDRFYRGDEARTQSNGGYGIGLSAARSIVQAHGGTIVAEYNKAEQALCFTARF